MFMCRNVCMVTKIHMFTTHLQTRTHTNTHTQLGLNELAEGNLLDYHICAEISREIFPYLLPNSQALLGGKLKL